MRSCGFKSHLPHPLGQNQCDSVLFVSEGLQVMKQDSMIKDRKKEYCYKRLIPEGECFMKDIKISDAIKYIGVDDADLDLFESQHMLLNGMAYNSYVILDEKTAVMETADIRKTEAWRENLLEVLKGRTPDYLIISHMEPDHSANIEMMMRMFPNLTLVCTVMASNMLKQFFDFELEKDHLIVVKDGDTLCLGEHTLQFITAPMVHWPEVMMEYEQKEKVMFTADAFGKFGTLDTDEEWDSEARRYYFNIVGKFGAQVQMLLNKVEGLTINTICPLHGPILKNNISYYIDKYKVWSSYEAEDEGVLIACASIYGHTREAAEKLKLMLEAKGVVNVKIDDLARGDISAAVADAFRYDKMILAAASYEGSVFPCMENFLNRLAHKGYKKRKVAVLENGSWAPSAGRTMKGILDKMENIRLCSKTVTIKSAMKEKDLADMNEMVDELIGL